MAASSSSKILFLGESAEEAEDFIFAIKERAYAKGKQKDNVWIADFASICFAKQALRWYEELDEETQSDWKLLRRAILAKYTHAPSSATIIPIAAPASPRSEYRFATR
ncbi:hypothetical protein FS837_012886 [Tulasnella sp. UAMH 9824]|nr:hypothetical protein FS837_012886 [Tulasnella sp. UAMH 9824]